MTSPVEACFVYPPIKMVLRKNIDTSQMQIYLFV